MLSLEQCIQVGSALLILLAYLLLQLRILGATSKLFAFLNMVGAGVLACQAGATRQWGFLLLEGTWSLISAVSLAALCWSAARAARCAAPS